MQLVKRSVWLGVVLMLAVACWGQGIIINEVAWSGTAASSADEWIELYNAGSSVVDLSGWRIEFAETVIYLGSEEGSTRNVRCSVLEPGAFLLLERTDDRAVDDRIADLIYSGSLSNTGCLIRLTDANGEPADTANLAGGNWPAGTGADGAPAYGSMERVDPLMPDVPSNWCTALPEWSAGRDATGEPVCGTPGAENTATRRERQAPCVELLHCGLESEHEMAVHWTAIDPDGAAGALMIDVEGSIDQGETWIGFVGDLANSGAYVGPIPESLVNGSLSETQLLVRIVATDADGWTSSVVATAAPAD